MTTLTSIRSKIRKVTGSPSQFQLSDAQIDEYINTFYLYDLPEHLRLWKLKRVYTFFTEPNVNEYTFPDESWLTVEPPVYVAGYQVRFIQDRDTFFMRWPPLNQLQQIGTGDGTPVPALQSISGTPIMRNTLYISAVINGNTITYNDNGFGTFDSEAFNIINISVVNPAQLQINAPGHNFAAGDTARITEVIGMLGVNNTTGLVSAVVPGVSFIYDIATAGLGTYSAKGIAVNINKGSINYATGAVTMNWADNTDIGQPINAQWVLYTAGRPYDVLFFNNKFNFRPVPDKAYKVEINAFQQPTSLFASTDAPELREWWQLIAYGASLKIFADRADFESLGQFSALMEEQKLLVQRRTLKQLTNQRVTTIYTNQNLYPQGNFYPYN